MALPLPASTPLETRRLAISTMAGFSIAGMLVGVIVMFCLGPFWERWRSRSTTTTKWIGRLYMYATPICLLLSMPISLLFVWFRFVSRSCQDAVSATGSPCSLGEYAQWWDRVSGVGAGLTSDEIEDLWKSAILLPTFCGMAVFIGFVSQWNWERDALAAEAKAKGMTEKEDESLIDLMA